MDLETPSSRPTIYLCYSEELKGLARDVIAGIKKEGIGDVLCDLESNGPHWLPRVFQHVAASSLFVLLHYRELDPYQNHEVCLALARNELEILALNFGTIGRLYPLNILGRGHIVSLEEQDIQDINKIVDAIKSAILNPVPLAQLSFCPYRDLAPFGEADSDFFAGRSAEVSEILAHIKTKQYLAIFGTSGSGKTSVIRAGVFPALRRGENSWLAFMVEPGPLPVHALCRSLLPLFEPRLSRKSADAKVRELAQEAIANPDIIRDRLAASLENLAMQTRVTIVLDPWDEYLHIEPLDRGRAADRRHLYEADGYAFRDVLTLLTKTDLVCVVLIAGAVALADHLLRAVHLLGDLAHYNLNQITQSQLREIIAMPASFAGVKVPELVQDEVISQLWQQPGSAALSQIIMAELWKPARAVHGVIDPFVLRDLKGARVVLGARLEALKQESGGTTENFEFLLAQLISLRRSGAIRRSASREDLDRLPPPVLKNLVSAHLIIRSRQTSDGSDERFDLAHQFLLDVLPTVPDWVDQNLPFLAWRDMLRRVMGASGGTLKGGILEDALRWRKKREHIFTTKELILLKQSERMRRNRRLFSVSWKIAALLIIGLVTGYKGKSYLQKNEESAAASKGLVSEALSLKKRALDEAILLAIEAKKLADIPESRFGLLDLVGGVHRLRAYVPRSVQKAATKVVFDSSGSYFLSSGRGGAELWERKEFRKQPGLPIDPDLFHVAAVSSAGVLAVYDGKAINFSNLETGAPIFRPIPIPEGVVQRLEFVRGSNSLIGLIDNAIWVWADAGLALAPNVVKLPTSKTILGFSVAPGGALALVDGSSVIYRVSASLIITTINLNGNAFNAIAFSSDGSLVAAGDDRGYLHFWNSSSWTYLGSSCGHHSRSVTSLAFGVRNEQLASGSADGTILLWRPSGRTISFNDCGPIDILEGHLGSVWSLAFGNNDRFLISGGDDSALMLWDIEVASPFAHRLGKVEDISAMAFDPSGHWLSVGTRAGQIRLLRLGGRNVEITVPGVQDSQITGLSFSPQGGTLAAIDQEGSLHLVKLTMLGDELRVSDQLIVAAGEAAWSLAFDPSGNYLAVGFESGIIGLYKMGENRYISRSTAIPDEVKNTAKRLVAALVFGRDGHSLYSGSYDGAVRRFQLNGGELMPVATVKDAHKEVVTSLAVSPDGLTLASGSADKTVVLWDIHSDLRRTGPALVNPNDYVSSVAYSHDGKLLAAATLRGQIFLWDTASRRLISENLNANSETQVLAFSPSTEVMATGDRLGALVWDIRDESVLKGACELVRRNLFVEEWKDYLGDRPYAVSCKKFPAGEARKR